METEQLHNGIDTPNHLEPEINKAVLQKKRAIYAQ
jgi:hypothetical protein